MKAKLYIDSEDSTIKVKGGPSDVLHLLVCAIAQILKGYFPDDFERQMCLGVWTALQHDPRAERGGRR